jgi:hypothetical protein
MKLDDVDLFERVQSQIGQLYKEMSIQAKNKPDNPINKFKLSIINEKLQAANTFLVGTFKPLAGFESFDEAALPTNSDVVIVLAQYLDGLEGWRSAHLEYDAGDFKWYWKTEGSRKVPASSPTMFRRSGGKDSK